MNKHQGNVLIVSTMLDLATDAVVRRLGALGVTCTRLNTETFPFESGMRLAIGMEKPFDRCELALRRPEATLLSSITPTSIWFRKVRIPERDPEMPKGVYDFCVREARSTLLGGLLAQDVPMMSPPANVWAAEHKVLQLRIAQKVGFTVPRTVITNDPRTVADAFMAFDRQMIAKPARSGYVDYGDEHRAIYTSQILEEHLEDLESTKWSPVIYQPLIRKACDVRVTYVAGELFVAEIDSQTEHTSAIDWRRTTNPALPHRSATLPRPLEKMVAQFMTTLGLVYGALDFIRTPSDEYIFLEVNPNGQWLWLEDRLGFPIAEKIAAWLSRKHL
jgi:glutathione synthase/RimK-type ligase-like ATP-grasp enzyme